MFQIQRAIVLSLAFVSDGALPVVAVHAVVVQPATMISRYVTAKVAFELDVGLFVCLTVVDAELVVLILAKKLALWTLHSLVARSSKHTHWSCFNFCILLFLESPYIIIVSTCPQTAKIRPSTCLTLEVVEMINSKLFKIMEVLTLWIVQALVQI